MFVNEKKLKAFKDKIGFDKAVRDQDPGAGVVANWDDILTRLSFTEKEWEITADDVVPMKSGVLRRSWIFQKAGGTIEINVYVSSAGVDRARHRLLTSATSTSLPSTPYVRGPEDLGQLSVRTPEEPLQDVIWVFKNVCVEIHQDDLDLSVEPVARAIQAFMERHVSREISKSLPKIDGVILSKNQLTVGQELEIAVRPQKTSAPEDVRITIDTSPDELDLTRESEGTSSFRALRPGKAVVDITASHLKLLLMSQAQVQVDIQPEK